MTFVYDKTKVRARVVNKNPTARYTFHSMEDSKLFDGIQLKWPTKPLAPTARPTHMIRGCYISLRTTFSADLKTPYYRIKVGKGTSGSGGVFGRSGDQGLPLLFSIDYPNAGSKGTLSYYDTANGKQMKVLFGPDSIIKHAIWNVEKDLIDIAKQVIGEVEGEDPFNLGGQTETFGWFRSIDEAFGAAKEIAKTFASYKPETLDREKITVFNWIEGKEIT